MSTPTTPQKPTTQLTLQGLENAVTPLRNRLLLTPTRNTQRKRYDPFHDLRTLADLFQLGTRPDLEPSPKPSPEPQPVLDTSVTEGDYNVQSFTTRNLSGFRLSGSSVLGPNEDTSFDTSRRTRLSMSSLPNTSNIAIPEAIYHQNLQQGSDYDNDNFDGVNQLDEFEIPDFSIPLVTKEFRIPSFNQNTIKKLMSSLGDWHLSPDIIDSIVETSNEFISQEMNDLAQMASTEGYNTINVLNVFDLINGVDLQFDLFGNKSQNEIFDLSIKLFDLEDTQNLNTILWPSKRRRPKKIMETIPDEDKLEPETEQGQEEEQKIEDSSEDSLAGFIDDNDVSETVDLNTLTTEIGIGITPDSPLEYEDYDIPMAEEEEE